MGSIPVGCDYDLRLYASDGSTLLGSSLNGGNMSELITYQVSANVDYYLRINSWLGSSTTSQYLLRAKVYPSETLNVPLYKQEAYNTCGCASGRMILAFYGITVSETQFKDKATALADPGTDFTYVYVVKNTINWFLSDSGDPHRYKYTNVSSWTEEQYKDLVLLNIMNSHPVQPVLKITSTAYFPYTTDGHYVVIKGMTYSPSLGYYSAVVNDPHYDYCDVYNVPISAIFSYNKAHSGYIICVD